MEFKTILSKFVYRIEAKPGGGFIATCKDPAVPAIEGATRDEVQQKIQRSISASLAAQFPALTDALTSNDVKLHYHVEAKPGGGFIVHHADAAHDCNDHSSRDHIERLIEAKIFSALIDRLPPELHQQITEKLNSGGVDIAVDRKISVTTKSGSPFRPVFANGTISASTPGLASEDTPSLANTSMQSASQSPIIRYDDNSPVQYEKSSSGTIFRFLIALAILAAMAYVFLHRH